MKAFYRIQSYGLTSPGKKSNINEVVGEALRDPRRVSHIDTPMIPKILFGKDLQETTAKIRQIKQDHIKAGHRKPLPNAQLLLGVVSSYPVAIASMTAKKYQDYLYWRSLTIKFVKKEYGAQLHAIIEHGDELYFHLHIWALAKTTNGQLTLGSMHPGQHAEKGQAPKKRKPAYKSAMENLQNRYYFAVGILMGWIRRSDNPEKRLNYKMAMVKKKKDKEAAEVAIQEEKQKKEKHHERIRENHNMLGEDGSTKAEHHLKPYRGPR